MPRPRDLLGNGEQADSTPHPAWTIAEQYSHMSTHWRRRYCSRSTGQCRIWHGRDVPGLPESISSPGAQPHLERPQHQLFLFAISFYISKAHKLGTTMETTSWTEAILRVDANVIYKCQWGHVKSMIEKPAPWSYTWNVSNVAKESQRIGMEIQPRPHNFSLSTSQ